MTEGEVEGKYVIVKRKKADRILPSQGAYIRQCQSPQTYVSTGPEGLQTRLRPTPGYVTGPQANAGRGFNASALYECQPQALAA